VPQSRICCVPRYRAIVRRWLVPKAVNEIAACPLRTLVASSDRLLASAVRKSPNLNAYAERFVRSIKEECLNRVVPLALREIAQLPGARRVDYRILPGSSPDTYAFYRTTAQRNLYRIPVRS
jgi:hypothetical protein